MALAHKSSGILGFQHNYRFLSNFWPCKIRWMGMTFPNTESAYQATKVDPELPQEEYDTLVNQIRMASTPAIAKRLGEEVKDKGKQRKDWHDISLQAMYELNKLKFTQDATLKKKLLDTGDSYIEETNNWGDVVYGVCNGRGQNLLGKILMRIRDELKQEKTENIQDNK